MPLVDCLLNIVKGDIKKKPSGFNYIYKNESDNAFFAHDAVHANSNRTYKIAINPKYYGYQRRLVSMMYKVLIKTGSGVRVISKSG